ncbi:hypothetical protein GCM10009642_10410 [Nocardiopsis metallicus]
MRDENKGLVFEQVWKPGPRAPSPTVAGVPAGIARNPRASPNAPLFEDTPEPDPRPVSLRVRALGTISR